MRRVTDLGRHRGALRVDGVGELAQTGQRLGSALGTAVAVGVLFALLQRGYATAGAVALGVCAGIIVACALLALVDVLRARRDGDALGLD